jgi:hypothetical protein
MVLLHSFYFDAILAALPQAASRQVCAAVALPCSRLIRAVGSSDLPLLWSTVENGGSATLAHLQRVLGADACARSDSRRGLGAVSCIRHSSEPDESQYLHHLTN